MPEVFQSSTWTIELPDGWSAKPHEDHVEIRLPLPGAKFRITPYYDESEEMSAAEWLRVAEHFTRKRRRPVLPRRCGDFVGHETRFDANGTWIRGWALLADGYGLDVSYRCASVYVGRDDEAVDGVLSTLRLRRPVT